MVPASVDIRHATKWLSSLKWGYHVWSPQSSLATAAHACNRTLTPTFRFMQMECPRPMQAPHWQILLQQWLSALTAEQSVPSGYLLVSEGLKNWTKRHCYSRAQTPFGTGVWGRDHWASISFLRSGWLCITSRFKKEMWFVDCSWMSTATDVHGLIQQVEALLHNETGFFRGTLWHAKQSAN